MKISELFNTIKKTAGSSDKSAIMQTNINDTIKQIFEDTYDNSKKYYVKKFNKDLSEGTKTVDDNYSEFRKVLNILSGRVVTGNAAIELVESVLAEFTKESQEILCSILDRNLKIGLSTETFSKLLGKEAPEKFEVTLAYNLDKVNGVNPIDGTYYASRKMDGCVSGDTIVEFENGLKIPISTVVENRIKGKIKSYDIKNEKIVFKDVLDWMHNIEDIDRSQKQWYQIELENGKKLKITGNDSLYVNGKGWTKVENITENDAIFCLNESNDC